MGEKESEKVKKLKEKLFLKYESCWKNTSDKEKKDIFGLAERYKKFLNSAKTERESVEEIKKELEKAGFKEISKIKNLKKGDKVFKTLKEKNIVAIVVGEKPEKINFIVSHIDSPRIDLKLKPFYEDSGMCLIKTNYYGGIRKYHWVNIPLAMHGVIVKKNNGKINVVWGEKENEGAFLITDLLPHLSKKQDEKKLKEGIEGEDLNIVVGSIPSKEKTEEAIKLNVLEILNKKYGITEKDFVSAEIEVVPAMNAKDIGIDRGLVGGYGQDDRMCAFAMTEAIKGVKNNRQTAIAMFTDKEEIGSLGNTSIRGIFLESFLEEYSKKAGLKATLRELFENMEAISADVDDGVNPNFKDVHDLKNAAIIGSGIVLTKYGGGGGKVYTNDANAEYVRKIMDLLEEKKIKWQTGLLGKVDEGGGGTVSMFIANRGAEIMDAGPVVLSMHSPYELSSKADLYETYKTYKEFFVKKQ